MWKFSVKQKAYAAIEAHFVCSHEERELRFRVIADGRPTFYRQCKRCGNAGRTISKGEAANELKGAQAPRFDTDLEAKWRAAKHAEYLAAYHSIKPILLEEYREYLASPAWLEKRQLILQNAGGICQCCEHFPATQVHHLTYERIGHELPSDLMAVCSYCHRLIHGECVL